MNYVGVSYNKSTGEILRVCRSSLLEDLLVQEIHNDENDMIVVDPSHEVVRENGSYTYKVDISIGAIVKIKE